MRLHLFVWLDRKVREWWPFLVSLAAVVLIVTMVWVAWTVVTERRYFELEQARDRRQDEQVQTLLEQTSELVARQRESDASREEWLIEAFETLDRVLADQFAAHDRNVAGKLNALLERIAVLLDRPAGEPLDPVASRDVADQPKSPREAGPSPPPSSTPPSTTTTTSPGQSDLCERIPTAFPCRSNR